MVCNPSLGILTAGFESCDWCLGSRLTIKAGFGRFCAGWDPEISMGATRFLPDFVTVTFCALGVKVLDVGFAGELTGLFLIVGITLSGCFFDLGTNMFTCGAACVLSSGCANMPV
ncbi:hypothetical protein OGATHE_002902 [Ogataea polymorpha]|uniref:Uncharacterized protein n=1 Tax=Ogataea polymorpha TaxID=460523 RepID=A0A9P8PER0_9ASCO|nr:hypothetical protein OGATHE_002902 [Ogataea polymorpha]